MRKLDLVVLVKQVPNIDKVKFDIEEGRIDRSSAEAEPNPFDLNALEEAVKYKEEIGAKITVISMGPQQAESTLRDTLARGADRAILLSDSKFAGADTWATSYTLASALKKLENFDIIFCGEKTVDGDTGQVGPEVAQILNIPHIAYVSKVLNRKEKSIIVESEVWDKTYEKEMNFPGLLTVTKDVNSPRLPTMKGKLKARKAEIETWGYEQLIDIADEEQIGFTGSPTAVKDVEIPKKKTREGEVFRDNIDGSVKKLARNIKKII